MADIVNQKFIEMSKEINKYLEMKNFDVCGKLSLDLIRISVYFNYSDGIFMSEFLENLIDDFKNISKYEYDENKFNEIVNKTLRFLNNIPEFIPIQTDNVWNLCKEMRDIRISVTKFQMHTSRTAKSIRRPFILEEGN